MTPGQKALYQRMRETRVNNAKRRAKNQEPHFTRFLTRPTKYKINTLKWERDGLLAEIDRLNAELIEARLAAEEAWDAHDEKETR